MRTDERYTTDMDNLIAEMESAVNFLESVVNAKPNWKIVPTNVDKHPSSAAFCDECGCPFNDGKPGCDCSA